MTMARYVMNTDNGELASVAFFWGTAHPTGYPLFTFLGFLASHFPFPVRPLIKLNFLNAAFMAAAIPFLFCSFRKMLCAIEKDTSKIDLPALTGALSVGLCLTFWAQTTSFEVYSLHALFLALDLYFISGILAYPEDKKNWTFLALTLGFGFTNHMSTIVLAPGLLLLFFWNHKPNLEALKRILILIFWGALPLLLFYGLLWFRASQDPLFNWGDPSNSLSFWRHVSGAQYQVWMFESSDVFSGNLKNYFKIWPEQFGYLGWALGIFGLWVCWKSMRKLFWLSVAFFLGNVLYVVNYSIHDLDPYFLLSYLITGLWIAIGAHNIFEKLRSLELLRYGLAVVLLSACIVSSYQKVDKSDFDLIERYSLYALKSLPENTLLISRQWDVFNSPCYYLQFVENVRPDVSIIGKELLRRSWYYDQLAQMYPETMERIEPQAKPFLKELEPFERDEKFDAQKLSEYFQGIFAAMVNTNVDERPVFIGPEILSNDIQMTRELAIPKGVLMYPGDYFIQLRRAGAASKEFNEDYDYAYNRNKDVYSQMIRQSITQIRTYQALYLISLGDSGKARKIVLDIKRKHRAHKLPPILVNLL